MNRPALRALCAGALIALAGAAYAQLEAKSRPVVERYGLKGFGAHSSNAEYVALDNIEPKLYLAARTIMDIATDKVR